MLRNTYLTVWHLWISRHLALLPHKSLSLLVVVWHHEEYIDTSFDWTEIEQELHRNSVTYSANRRGTLLLPNSRFCVGTPGYCFGCWLDWIWIRFGHAATCQSMAAQLLLSSSSPSVWTIETIHVAACRSDIYQSFVLCLTLALPCTVSTAGTKLNLPCHCTRFPKGELCRRITYPSGVCGVLLAWEVKMWADRR